MTFGSQAEFGEAMELIPSALNETIMQVGAEHLTALNVMDTYAELLYRQGELEGM